MSEVLVTSNISCSGVFSEVNVLSSLTNMCYSSVIPLGYSMC